MGTTTATAPRRYPGRLLMWLGLAVAILGVAGYVVQVNMHYLKTPWYTPIAATLGVVLIGMSLWQKRTVWRWLALVPVILLAGFEWFILVHTQLPEYKGPVKRDDAFPAFTTARADGSVFTDHDLQGDKDNVMVFFRGRW